MEDEGYSEECHPSPTERLNLIQSLIVANHGHLAERGGLAGLDAATLSANLSADHFSVLATLDVTKRQELAYLLMLSLPTPALAELQARIHPLISFDLLGLLPPELCRCVLSHLDVQSILNAALVCRAWHQRIWFDQLLWRALYEREAWGYDAKAIDWWNSQTSVEAPALTVRRHSNTPDEGMAIDEDESQEATSPPDWLLPPQQRGDIPMQDISTGRTSPNLGLPPSPRHLNHPPLRSAGVPPRFTEADEDDDDDDDDTSTSSLRLRHSRPTSTSIGQPPRQRRRQLSATKTLQRGSKGFQAVLGLYGPRQSAPLGFDACRVSRVHFDKEGRPWVNWRHLYVCRTHIERNWRHGRFVMYEMHKPDVLFESSGPPPPSMHPVGTPHADGVYALQCDGDRLVAGLRGGIAIRFDLRTGRPVKQYRFHTGSVLCLQYDTPETKLDGIGDRLVTGSSDGHAVVWDLESGRLIHDLHGHGQSVLSVGFSGDVLATCSKDRQIILWSMTTGQHVRILEGHRSAVNAIAFKDGLIASASGDRDVRIWSAETGECLKILTGHLGGIAALSFDGHYVATGSSDSTVRIVDIRTGACQVEIGTPDLEHHPVPQAPRQPGAPMTLYAAGQTQGLAPVLGHAHQELVRTLAFDSRFIVTGSYDETLKVWDRHTGLLILDIHAHSTRIFNLQFDVSRIISCSQAGIDEIRIIDFLPGADVSFLLP